MFEANDQIEIMLKTDLGRMGQNNECLLRSPAAEKLSLVVGWLSAFCEIRITTKVLKRIQIKIET